MSIFSLMYSAYEQKKVEDALSANDLESAVKWLEKMPVALRDADKVGRAVIIGEGYRAVTKAYSETGNKELKDLTDLIREKLGSKEGEEITGLLEGLEMLEDYKDFGSLELLEKCLSELGDYNAIGSVERLRADLDNLQEYEKLGDVGKLKDISQEMTEYRELVREELECKEGEELARVEKVIGEFKDYKEIGTVEDLKELSDKLEEYQELGSVEELRKLVNEEREIEGVLARL